MKLPNNYVKWYRKVLSIAVIAASGLLVAACGDDDDKPVTEEALPSIFDIAATDDRFDTLELALTTTGLDAALDDETATFTVFAPTDEAFAALGTDTINALLADTDTLSNILTYHVISGAAVNSTTALSLAGMVQEMLNGDNVAITLQDGDLFINDAQVIVTDVLASNGIIHAIDTVLIPPSPTVVAGTIVDAALATPELSTLVTALMAANLVDTLNDESKAFTVFAPVNSAFDKIDPDALTSLLADTAALTDILLFHVISDLAVDSITAASLTGESVTMTNGDAANIVYSDGKLFINGAEIITRDIQTTNGIVHLIDTVIMPPLGSIVDVAVADGRFTTLVAALQATGLAETLADTSATFTVFAPTDDAFALLGQNTINALLADTDTLSNILLYHVIADASVNAAAALDVAEGAGVVTMANGDDVSLTIVNDSLFINSSQVIVTDVISDNGIIHAIDAVLTPPTP